jgi:hypothetical protein
MVVSEHAASESRHSKAKFLTPNRIETRLVRS